MPRLPLAPRLPPAAVSARGQARTAVGSAPSVATRAAFLAAFLVCAPMVDSAVLPGLARADDAAIVCTREPREHWMSAAAISEKAVRAGYPNIRQIKVVGTCYEIDALTARRMRADVVMDPVTGDVVQAWMGRLPE